MTATVSDALVGELDKTGFAFVPAERMREMLAAVGPRGDWEAFAESWNRLGPDEYMADGGRYRRRRYGVFNADRSGAIVRETHQPHFQTVDFNPLNGGIERWFDPIETGIGDGESLRTVLAFCRDLFGSLARDARRWHMEVHQFRIEARPGEAGQPTPEGMHRDGVDYVLVLLIRRRNIVSGRTTICGLDKRTLGSFTLTEPLDAAIVDDSRVYHGVTAVEPEDASAPAYRDVLVVTLRRQD